MRIRIATRADGIVRAMMQHAAGGAGQFSATDLNALVVEYVDLAYHGKRARTPDFFVTMTTDLDPDVGEVEIVPQDIGRATSADGANGYRPEVKVKTSLIGSFVEVAVSDNGIGIDDSNKDKIFQPYFTTKRPEMGPVLG
jgi:nitrogen fixation/metabolism regulation signal transduction histidine kinase